MHCWLQQLPSKSRAGRHQMTLSCLLLGRSIHPEYHKLLPETTICKTKPCWVNSAPEYSWIVWMLWLQRSDKAAVLHRSLQRSTQNPHPKLTGCSRSAGTCPFVLCRLGLDDWPWVSTPTSSSLHPLHQLCSYHLSRPPCSRKPWLFHADVTKQEFKSSG